MSCHTGGVRQILNSDRTTSEYIYITTGIIEKYSGKFGVKTPKKT